jgi:hypothetical protein
LEWSLLVLAIYIGPAAHANLGCHRGKPISLAGQMCSIILLAILSHVLRSRKILRRQYTHCRGMGVNRLLCDRGLDTVSNARIRKAARI